MQYNSDLQGSQSFINRKNESLTLPQSLEARFGFSPTCQLEWSASKALEPLHPCYSLASGPCSSWAVTLSSLHPITRVSEVPTKKLDKILLRNEMLTFQQTPYGDLRTSCLLLLQSQEDTLPRLPWSRQVDHNLQCICKAMSVQYQIDK